MTEKPTIAMFWTGSELGLLERLSLYSFAKDGYPVKLFSASPIETRMEGVEVIDHREIVDLPENSQPSFQADIFRLYLQRKTDFIWMDIDVLSYRPIRLNQGYLMSDSYGAQINNSSLRLPKDSPALDMLINYIEDPSSIPPWLRERDRKQLETIDLEERLVTQGALMRIVYGPRGLDHCVRATGEAQYAYAADVLIPVPWYLSDVFFNPKGGVEGWITKHTQVIHLYKSEMRRWNRNRPLPPGCFLDQYIKDSGFDLAG